MGREIEGGEVERGASRGKEGRERGAGRGRGERGRERDREWEKESDIKPIDCTDNSLH